MEDRQGGATNHEGDNEALIQPLDDEESFAGNVKRKLPTGFELRRSESSQDPYLYNPYTGETVYGVTEDEDLSKISRLRSFWRRPEHDLVDYMKLIAKAQRQSGPQKASPTSKLSVEQAASLLLKLGRRILAMSRAYQKVAQTYEKRIDHQSGYFYYYNTILGTSQWHKPILLRSYKDLPLTQDPEQDQQQQQLALQEEGESYDPLSQQEYFEEEGEGQQQLDGGTLSLSNDELAAAAISSSESSSSSYYCQTTENGSSDMMSKTLIPLTSRTDSGMFLGRTAHTRLYNRVRFQQGPLYHRIGPCRSTGFIRTNNFTRLRPFLDQPIVQQLQDIDTETTGLNDKFVFEEKYARRQVALNEYLLPRTASLEGAEKVLMIMKRCPENLELTLNCFLQLSKFKYEATSEGAATYLAVEVIDTCLQALASPDQRLRLGALAFLPVPLTEYANRATFKRKDGIKVLSTHLERVQKKKQIIKYGNERVVQSISEYQVSVAYYGCKIISMLAYDEPREGVCEDCLDLVLQCLEACRDDAEVLIEGLKALYNFVFLCEFNHILLSEKKVTHLVENFLETYASDKELLQLGKRTLTALGPDGWRAKFDGTVRGSSRPTTTSYGGSRPSTKGGAGQMRSVHYNGSSSGSEMGESSRPSTRDTGGGSR